MKYEVLLYQRIRNLRQDRGLTQADIAKVLNVRQNTYSQYEIGAIKYPLDVAEADKMFETALEAGANDVVSDDECHEIETLPDDLNAVTEALEKAFGTPSASRLDWKPTVKTDITDLETAQKFLDFVDALEDDDDVQKVYHNAEFSEAVMEACSAVD